MLPPTYCVIGKPLIHSLSPGLHSRLLAHYDRPGVYLPFETDKADQAVEIFRSSRMRGASVTLPLKVDVVDLVDELEPAARKIGAVNTLYWREETLVGANTDADGVKASMEKLNVPLDGGTVLLLGTGGAARVAAYVLLMQGVSRLVIAARRLEQGQLLIDAMRKNFPESNLEVVDWDQWPAFISNDRVQALVNSTPLGMFPEVDNSPINDSSLLEKTQGVLDLVYNPRKTRLIGMAEAKGLPAVGGLEMFTVQAARQFFLWNGIRPDPELVRKIVLELLGQ